MFTANQISLQTFLANGLVPAKNVAFATSIANWKKPSPKQVYHIDRMVNEIVNGQNTQTPALAAQDFDSTKIFELFANAAKKLKYPKINLKTTGNRPLRLNTSRKYPDTVFLGSGGFGTESYGKLTKSSGIVWYNKDAATQQDVEAMVKAFAADPVKVSADFGKLNHNCCYCMKGLDTAESLAVGYGPVCAEHYGLPWGKNTPRTKPIVSELVNVVSPSQALKSDLDELMASEDFEAREAYG